MTAAGDGRSQKACSASRRRSSRQPDPLFDCQSDIVMGGPTDVAENHDKYLEQSQEEDYQQQLGDWKAGRK